MNPCAWIVQLLFIRVEIKKKKNWKRKCPTGRRKLNGHLVFFFFFLIICHLIILRRTTWGTTILPTSFQDRGRQITVITQETCFKSNSIYLATEWATEFRDLLTQQNSQLSKNTLMSAASWVMEEMDQSNGSSALDKASKHIFESPSIMMLHQFSTAAKLRAHRIAATLAWVGVH